MPASKATENAIKRIREKQELARQGQSGPLPGGEGPTSREGQGTTQLDINRSGASPRPYGLPSGSLGKNQPEPEIQDTKKVGLIKGLVKPALTIRKGIKNMSQPQPTPRHSESGAATLQGGGMGLAVAGILSYFFPQYAEIWVPLGTLITVGWGYFLAYSNKPKEPTNEG